MGQTRRQLRFGAGTPGVASAAFGSAQRPAGVRTEYSVGVQESCDAAATRGACELLSQGPGVQLRPSRYSQRTDALGGIRDGACPDAAKANWVRGCGRRRPPCRAAWWI